MLATTIFRRVNRPSMCKGLTDLLRLTREGTCLNRYAAATGFLKPTLLDYQPWDIVSLQLYANSKRHSLHLKTIQSRDLIRTIIERKRQHFIERKNVLVKDIYKTKSKVQEKVREKMEEVIERENVLTLPNLLTIGRAALAPYIGYVIVEGNFSLAIGLLITAGATDLLDGYIARNWPNQASKAGSFLDPMADKVLIGALVTSMACSNLLPVWLAGMILFRDVFLLGAGFFIRYISLPSPRTISRYFDATYATAQLEPTFVSKANTFVQLTAIGLSLGAPICDYIDHSLLQGLWYVTGATTVAAALSYVLNRNTYKILKKQA